RGKPHLLAPPGQRRSCARGAGPAGKQSDHVVPRGIVHTQASTQPSMFPYKASTVSERDKASEDIPQ
ncbi:hypothetical protein M8818_005630, partial [Zalaria obscura]